MAAALYQQVLGDAWTRIAEPIRRAHDTNPMVRAHGLLRIEHGRHYLARVLARVLRLPRPSAAARTHLAVTARGEDEQWERTFNGRRVATRQFRSRASELAERFGIIEFRFRLEASDGSLLYVQREAAVVLGPVRWRIPASLAPRVEAREDPAGATGVKVDVRVDLPGVGRVIAYDGVIEIEDNPLITRISPTRA